MGRKGIIEQARHLIRQNNWGSTTAVDDLKEEIHGF